MSHSTHALRRQVHFHVLVGLQLRLVLGRPWLGHSSQCYPCHHSLLDPPYQHLVWLNHRFQSAHCPWHGRTPVILHDLHWLNGPTTLQGPTTLEVPVFPWKIRFSGQHPVVVVSDAQLCDGMLPTREKSDGAEYELEYPHSCGCDVSELELLLGTSKAQL